MKPTKQLAEKLSLVLGICGSSSRPKFNLRNQTAVLCCLMPYLVRQDNDLQLYQSDLLGQYAMTKERYGLALRRTAYYLLQLPKDAKDIRRTASYSLQLPKDVKEIPQTPIIREVLPIFLARSPPNTDLCFLVALIYPVVIRAVEEIHETTRRAVMQGISTYIQRVSNLFIYLNLSASI